jgi:PTH1 family peptidyl-tRNA hydrolase
MQILVGLGNPGSEYAATRHNAGFLAVDHLAARFGVRVARIEGQALTGRGAFRGRELLLAKPQTYMNRSGRSVQALLGLYGAGPADLLVLCDDLDLPLGQLRLRPSGGGGTHKGLQSILEALRTPEFPRLRIGIGPQEGDAADFVLQPFPQPDLEALNGLFPRLADGVERFLDEGVEAAMRVLNPRPPAAV